MSDPRICAWCGAEFTPNKPDSRTCSKGCGAKLREARRSRK